jgi:hypothetical protein
LSIVDVLLEIVPKYCDPYAVSGKGDKIELMR